MIVEANLSAGGEVVRTPRMSFVHPPDPARHDAGRDKKVVCCDSRDS